MKTPSGILARSDLQTLFDALTARGYDIIAPTVRDGAIVPAPMTQAADLPFGWTDSQAPGHYRLKRRNDQAAFGFGPTATAWKRTLHPPSVTLFTATRDGETFTSRGPRAPPPRQALMGIRACDLSAIAVQDAVLDGAHYQDATYHDRRTAAFLVAVTCGHAAATCFCAAVGTGPGISAPCDIALTELLTPTHRFLVEAHSPAGADVVAALPLSPATPADHTARETIIATTTRSQSRSLPANTPALLTAMLDHPHWQTIGERCLSCGNCTSACPTCFCTTIDDDTTIDGQTATRRRTWDSCFGLEFSYIHGGAVRSTTASRYRQWMTHKLSTWQEQFGTSGCVGCGRCITWCPVGIDITQEVAALDTLNASPGHKRAEP